MLDIVLGRLSDVHHRFRWRRDGRWPRPNVLPRNRHCHHVFREVGRSFLLPVRVRDKTAAHYVCSDQSADATRSHEKYQISSGHTQVTPILC